MTLDEIKNLEIHVESILTNKDPSCKYKQAWLGPCGKEVHTGEFCNEHNQIQCSDCEKQALGQCQAGLSIVCGKPTCGEHGLYGVCKYHGDLCK